MARTNPKRLIDSLRSGDMAKVRAVIRSEPETARSPQVVGEAARLGWTEALELLLKQGADLNASWRNYRPLHSVIQEEPHSERPGAEASRLACLKWMLANGADPEQLGGWPATRAIITAAFVGEPAYVAELRRAGAGVDGFVAAALGDMRHVEKALAKEPS